MSVRVNNAIIMAAGLSSRFAPLSYEKPKALIRVKGEVLIERQIRQLQSAGIEDISLVVGYRKEDFVYLTEKFGVRLIENPEYSVRNNNSSIKAAKQYLHNTYICSADNYFEKNPFEKEVDEAYYAAVYAQGETKEWCMETDSDGWITNVTVGGADAWYMLGHAFWTEEFSRRFVEILDEIYDRPETAPKFWETIFMENLDRLKMKMRKYPDGFIYEFDSLDELREFDETYQTNSGCATMADAARQLNCPEGEIKGCSPWMDRPGHVAGFRFEAAGKAYSYAYDSGSVQEWNG